VVHAIPAAEETSNNCGEIEVRRYVFRMATLKFKQILRSVRASVEVEPAGGPVVQAIREAVLKTGAEFVVIGRGYTRRRLGPLRTGAHSIIRNSPCPC
jgi:hypothetical protein